MAKVKEFPTLSAHIANYREALGEPGINLAKIALWYGIMIIFMVAVPIMVTGSVVSGLLAGFAIFIAQFGILEHLRLRMLAVREEAS